MSELDKTEQFETVAILKAYANKIYMFPNDEVRPSEVARLKEIVEQMARVAKRLVIA